MYNNNLCSLVESDCEFTVTTSNMCGISLYLKLYEFQYHFWAYSHTDGIYLLKIGTFVHFHMYNHNLCSLVESDCEFTVTTSNMCGISLYLKLYEFQYLFWAYSHTDGIYLLKIGTFVHFHMYNHNLCSLVESDREFTVTPSNMCGISLYLKLYEFQYLFWAYSHTDGI